MSHPASVRAAALRWAAAAAALPPAPASCSGSENLRPLSLGDAAPVVNVTANGSTKRVVTANLTAPLLVLHGESRVARCAASGGRSHVPLPNPTQCTDPCTR